MLIILLIDYIIVILVYYIMLLIDYTVVILVYHLLVVIIALSKMFVLFLFTDMLLKLVYDSLF